MGRKSSVEDSFGKGERKRYGENTLNDNKKPLGGYFAGKIWMDTERLLRNVARNDRILRLDYP